MIMETSSWCGTRTQRGDSVWQRFGLGLLRHALSCICFVLLFFGVIIPDSLRAEGDQPEPAADPAQVTIGERLFLETRFAQFFFAHSTGDANKTLTLGDPVMDFSETTGSSFPGPFAGQSMNCRSCHLIDEHRSTPGGGVRTYADFARRSPIPAREDGNELTPRNSPSLVNSTLPGLAHFFHYDGEFATMEDLVKATLTGRNYGWLPPERKTAIDHIAHVIRKDDGKGVLAMQTGGSYRKVLAGSDEDLSDEFRLPEGLRINVGSASDQQILDVVARLITAYVRSLRFSQDEKGAFNGSPFDVFLRKNKLPLKPDSRARSIEYARKLRDLIETLSQPSFVDASDGKFTLHQQEFVFGQDELDGLKIFLAEPKDGSVAPMNSGGIGNCIACHAPPNFTDFAFHNIGVTQEEYDARHGSGSFVKIQIPDWKTRKANFDAFLPATRLHPDARGIFLAIASAERPELTDLGLWNVFGNPDKPRPQKHLTRLLKQTVARKSHSKNALLESTVALFKTPGLRDLSHSAPYLHTGNKDFLEDVILFYIEFSNLSRAGLVRNAAPELNGISLVGQDIFKLRAFLKALNEDYQ